jgi:hypothetical protein
MAENLTRDEREEIAVGIENEGIGYWVMHYGYKGDNDSTLRHLCFKARRALDELEDYLHENDLMY